MHLSTLLPYALLNRYYDYYERYLRRRYKLYYPRLDARLMTTKLEASNADAHANVPSDSLPFFEGLHHLPIKVNESVFLDYGCGSGKIIAFAAIKGFKKVIGIELDQEALEYAKANAERIKGAAISFINADAALVAVPDDVEVIYFFNPFGSSTMRAVLQQLKASYLRSPRPLFVLYQNPVEDALFYEMSFKLIHQEQLPNGPIYYSCWKYD